jgi:hypothetical protein
MDLVVEVVVMDMMLLIDQVVKVVREFVLSDMQFLPVIQHLVLQELRLLVVLLCGMGLM